MAVQVSRRPGGVVGALNVCMVCCRLEVVSIGLKRSLQMNNSQSVSRKGRLHKSRRVAQKLAPLVVALGMALPVSSVNATGMPVADISHTIQNIFTQMWVAGEAAITWVKDYAEQDAQGPAAHRVGKGGVRTFSFGWSPD